MGTTPLSEKILKRCDFDKLASDHPLRAAAVKFNELTEGYYSEPQTVDVKQFIGQYARTRILWCKYSGESL